MIFSLEQPESDYDQFLVQWGDATPEFTVLD